MVSFPTGAATAVCALVALLVVVLAAAPHDVAHGQPGVPVRYLDLVFDQVDRTLDVKYGSAIDQPTGRPTDLMVDIYEPRGDEEIKRPVFLFVHGGGFVSGNKSIGRWYCEPMAKRGYVAMSMSYRLNQGNVYPDGMRAATSDARQAVRWIQAQAERYRVDTDRITIGGSSAGAITSLFVAYTDWELEPGGDTSADVAAVMDLWGGLYTEVRQMEAGEPPLVIIHGTNDSVVRYSEAEALVDRAEEVGIPYSLHALQGKGHAPFDPEQHMTWTAEFFYDQLWAEQPTPTTTARPTATLQPTQTDTPAPTSPPSATPTATPDRSTIYLPMTSKEPGGIGFAAARSARAGPPW